MSYSEIVYEVRGATARITLNRPEKRNCWNGDMYERLGEIVSDFGSDDSLRCAMTECGRKLGLALQLVDQLGD